jgi:hypothetical protein
MGTRSVVTAGSEYLDRAARNGSGDLLNVPRDLSRQAVHGPTRDVDGARGPILPRAEDERIALMFDDLKRSNAVLKLGAWRRYEVLSDDELKQFSEETQRNAELLSEL